MHVLLDSMISPSQTHGFKSLWKMSSETHAIQKNSPHSTVPLKSNEKLAVFIKIRLCSCNAHNHDPGFPPHKLTASIRYGKIKWDMCDSEKQPSFNCATQKQWWASRSFVSSPLTHVGPSHRKAALTQLRLLECRVVAPTRHPTWRHLFLLVVRGDTS